MVVRLKESISLSEASCNEKNKSIIFGAGRHSDETLWSGLAVPRSSGPAPVASRSVVITYGTRGRAGGRAPGVSLIALARQS